MCNEQHHTSFFVDIMIPFCCTDLHSAQIILQLERPAQLQIDLFASFSRTAVSLAASPCISQ